MKLKQIFTLVVTALVLSSCGGGSTSTSTNTSDSSTSTSSSSSTSEEKKNGQIDLYCINDFHGRVSQTISTNSYGYSTYESGVSRLATYLKTKEADNPNGSVFLNAGDMWQDTYDSAMNKGELLTKAMVEMKCEAMALGNHEFDWGIDTIKANRALAESDSNDTKFTFLGCNIYNYSTNTQASDLCAPYKVIQRGDIKIGLIGAIGANQITSITSSNWENLTFVNPVSIVKSTSDYLRSEQNCDLVVYMFHGKLDDSSYQALSATSSLTNKPYVDAGFLGHSHSFESVLYNGVPWIQSYQHGAVLGHVTLSITDGSTSCTYYPKYDADSSYRGRYECGYGNGVGSIYASSEDSGVNAIVNSYLTSSFVSTKNAVVGTLTNMTSTTVGKEIGNIQAYATSKYLDELRSGGASIPNVDIVINNGNRDQITTSDGKITRENVFNLTPFTNKTIIANVLGSNIINECITYSNPYYLPGEASLVIDANATYTVACIDYLLLHKNAYRNYDYFNSFNGEKRYVVDKLPYDIVADYLIAKSTFDMSTLSGAAYTGLSA